jgi:predicted O-methyltransferase YrrM
MHGFRTPLIDWLKKTQPACVIEWGPGLSTEIILQHAPTAKLVSIEHAPEYHAAALAIVEKMQAADRAEVLLRPCTNRKSGYATEAYNHAPFDLAFVDGRRRVECVLIALTCLRPGGVVILHDACRIEYTRVLAHYADTIECRANTLVMRPRHLILTAPIVPAITP